MSEPITHMDMDNCMTIHHKENKLLWSCCIFGVFFFPSFPKECSTRKVFNGTLVRCTQTQCKFNQTLQVACFAHLLLAPRSCLLQLLLLNCACF